MSVESSSNKRLAKNTVVLYMRTIVLMLVALYTSRVILDVLGVDDYGIYDVVGGAIAMFGVVSGSIANAISRFITFELGKGDPQKLKKVFITSVNIQITIGVVVLFLGETVGLWFLNTYMNIPDGRMPAANWVLHCSILAFVINLLSIPYNACIIAHEKMTAYAYIGILDAVLRLAIVLILPLFHFDKLIVYSILVVIEALLIRIIYAIYCNQRFRECKYSFSINYPLMKEMAGFSGWQFLSNTCWIVSNQGINLLTNLFFGVSINAARGIASQVSSAIMQFVNNFMTALNPQLVKSYAKGENERFFDLICRGAKFSFFLMLFFALPILIETNYVLGLWLRVVPDNTVIFVRLSIIAAVTNMVGNTCVAACVATGDLKKYALIISSIGYSVFPLTWLAFLFGYKAEVAYVIFIIIYFIIIFARLYVMKGLIGFPPFLFVHKVLFPILLVATLSLLLPILFTSLFDREGFLRFILVTIICSLSVALSVFIIGLDKNETNVVLNTIKNKIKYDRFNKER